MGVTFSFLISSPLVDLASFLMLMSFFGVRIALAYVLVGLVLAVVGGTLIDRLQLEDQVASFVRESGDVEVELETLNVSQRIHFSKTQVIEIVQRVWLYILIGVGIGALIHNWVPQAFVEAVVGKNNPFAVILAAIVGIPMYADIFGTLPIAEALFSKGVGIGTVLSFMMAVTALSLPSMIMLNQVVKKKLLVIFIGIVSLGIIFIGYLFNALHVFF